MAQIQLLAQGIQDAWLSGKPQVSFYRSNFKRHVPFGLSIEQFTVPMDGKIVINTKSDLLGYTYLTAYDRTTGALVPYPAWTNIISTVELVIGNQTIAIHDLTYINTIQKVSESDTYSKRSSTTSFQPLGFFFDRQALPLVALKYADVKINITWNSTTAATQYIYKCWSHCIRLGEDERRFFATRRHQMLIPQIQRVPVSREPFFRGPLKYLAAPCVYYPAVYGSWVTKFVSNGVVGTGAHIVQDGYSYYTITYTSGPLYLYNSDGSVFSNNLASIGTQDVAVTKIDPSGNIVWCASMGAPGKLTSVNDIQSDATGTYIVGIFLGTITFNNSDGTPFGTTLTEIVSGTVGDGFVVKYDLNGNVLWCTKWGLLISTSAVRAWSIKIDPSGLYVSGRTTTGAAIQFYNSDGAPNTATPAVSCSYVAKYDKNGFLLWRSTQRYASSVGENYALALDSTQVYTSAGIGNTTVTFYNSIDTIGGTLVTTGTQNNYIGAYNATTGNFVWSARTASTSPGGVFGFFRAADADSSGIYFVGSSTATGTIYLYKSDGTQSSVSVSGVTPFGFMASYDSAGNALWAIKIDNVDRINSVTVYNGIVYVNGFFSGTSPATFYNSNGSQYQYTLTLKGSTRDTYVAAYTTSGDVRWVVQGASTISSTMARFGIDQSVYFPGHFTGTNMLLYNQSGNSILSPLPLTGTQTGFLYKFNPW